jgi:hypothetical protein
MDSYVEQYQGKHGGVTLHTWTDGQEGKKDNFYITGVSGTPVASGSGDAPREALLLSRSPTSPSDFYT